jgi:FkbM family methyltransferase
LAWSLFGDRTNGFFVDVGAFDGVHLSNTLSFEQQGWRGICLEPHPTYFPYLVANRKDSICLSSACVESRRTKSVRFLSEPLGLLSGIRADLTPNMTGRYAIRGMKFPGFTAVEVPAITLNEILDAHLPSGREIDFVSIDVEGTELEVVKGLDLKRFPARLLVVESNDQESAEALKSHMEIFGYTLAREIKQNLFFASAASDVEILKNTRINCQIERTLHPLGEKFTSNLHMGGERREL